MTLYQVTGRVAYRGHPPNAQFEASLEPAAEQRAVNRRSIRIIDRSTPTLQPGSYRLPAGNERGGAVNDA